MKPLRMCMVCRKRREKEALIRVVRRTPEGAAVDLTGKEPGRGAYVCRERACIEQAQQRRVLERAFSGRIDPAVYERLRRETEELLDES